MNMQWVNKCIQEALLEDIGFGDITTESIVDNHHTSTATMIAKSAGTIAGLEVARQVFAEVDPDLKFRTEVSDGDSVKPQRLLATVEGRTHSILKAERVALNILQRMCGIATVTKQAVDRARPYGVKICDTRKTTPGLRMLEKAAVRAGGGVNHRLRLDDAVLIKDNHIAAAGGIREAVMQVRKHLGHMVKIEVETENMDQVREAIQCEIDVIMLDNMSVKQMREAVAIIPNHMITEASGSITLERIDEIAGTGVNVISLGWITHSAPVMDISLNVEGSVKENAEGG